MNFPNGGVAILQQYYNKYPNLAKGSEDDRRLLIRKIGSSFVAHFGDRWGTKSTTKDHPQSKDTLVYKNDDGTVDVWDTQNGTTKEISVKDNTPATYPRTNHFFIALPALDEFASVTTEPPFPPNPDQTVIKLLTEIRDSLRVVAQYIVNNS